MKFDSIINNLHNSNSKSDFFHFHEIITLTLNLTNAVEKSFLHIICSTASMMRNLTNFSYLFSFNFWHNYLPFHWLCLSSWLSYFDFNSYLSYQISISFPFFVFLMGLLRDNLMWKRFIWLLSWYLSQIQLIHHNVSKIISLTIWIDFIHPCVWHIHGFSSLFQHYSMRSIKWFVSLNIRI